MNNYDTSSDIEQQLIDARLRGHADGQVHAISDVNVGLVDDMIAPRLNRLRADLEEQYRLQIQLLERHAADASARADAVQAENSRLAGEKQRLEQMGPEFHKFADMVVPLFHKQMAVNNLEIRCDGGEEVGELTILIQRRAGKTQGELLSEAQGKILILQQERVRLAERVAEGVILAEQLRDLRAHLATYMDDGA